MSFGVPDGAIRPNQMLASRSGRPTSATVGTSGNTLPRFGAAHASAFSVPALMCGSTTDTAENMIWVRPARRSVTAGELP
jgi:hypothetical protein